MTDTVDVPAKEVDPLENAIMTLQFSVKEINSILNVLGQAPFIQVAGIINAIQNQCAPQVNAFNDAAEKPADESQATA